MSGCSYRISYTFVSSGYKSGKTIGFSRNIKLSTLFSLSATAKKLLRSFIACALQSMRTAGFTVCSVQSSTMDGFIETSSGRGIGYGLEEDKCGTVVREDGSVYIYYASSDIRFYVATSIIDRLLDCAFHNSSDPLRSSDCVKQRCELINRNFAFIKGESGC